MKRCSCGRFKEDDFKCTTCTERIRGKIRTYEQEVLFK